MKKEWRKSQNNDHGLVSAQQSIIAVIPIHFISKNHLSYHHWIALRIK